jgi:hypothetical protein
VALPALTSERPADRGLVVAVGRSITKTSHDQWALARRAQATHLALLDAMIAMICHRLSVPVGD